VHAVQDRHPGCQDHYECGKALAQDFATLICLHLLGPAVVPSYVVCVEAAGFDQAMKIEDALRKIRLLRRIILENGASGFEAETAARLVQALMERYSIRERGRSPRCDAA
jgi:hypothetical protein